MSIFSQRPRSSRPDTGTRPQGGRGFTLIELLVVMAIMVIITSVFLVRQNRFDSSTLLRSLAYSVALSVRQAQVYGTSVFGTTTIGTTVTYASGYGIYFSAANPSQYILFADLDNNGTYSGNTEIVKIFSFNSDYVISDFCATEVTTSNVDCWVANSGVLGSSATLSIIFKRPNPDACFTTNLSTAACAVGASAAYSAVSVKLANTSDPTNTRSINLNSTGEIGVCAITGC